MLKNKIIQNILFVLGAIFLVVAAWGLFQLFGEWTFILITIPPLILIAINKAPPKFGNKNPDGNKPDE